jgi:hypothetical protein
VSNTRKATASKTSGQLDIATLLGEDARPEKIVRLCLRGNLQAEWDELKAQYDAGPDDEAQALLVERANKRRIAEQMARVEAEMRAGTVPFRLRALPRRRSQGMPAEQVAWDELVAKHPPRKDANGKVNVEDLRAGFNTDTFWDPLVRASVVDPELTDEQWGQLDAKLTEAQYQTLMLTALHLNRGEIDVPFSRAASIVRNFDAGSRRQSDSASPSDGSKAGNRSRSQSTSTTSKAG